jgi:20S proteasome alpha/beta subunit
VQAVRMPLVVSAHGLKRPINRRPRQMTFIAGFNCRDGIVLCADQMDTDGTTKRYRHKIEGLVMNDQWSFSWACSGDSDIIDKFSDKLKYQLKHIEDFKREDIELATESVLTLIHQYHERQPIKIVAGLWSKGIITSSHVKVAERVLYRGRSDNQCLARESDYCLGGMDVTLAEFILRNTFKGGQITVDEAVRLGIFVTALMKEYADGVAGDTNVMAYRVAAPGWKDFTQSEIKEIENEISTQELAKEVTSFWSKHQ